jgi:hypothetical protein
VDVHDLGGGVDGDVEWGECGRAVGNGGGGVVWVGGAGGFAGGEFDRQLVAGDEGDLECGRTKSTTRGRTRASSTTAWPRSSALNERPFTLCR